MRAKAEQERVERIHAEVARKHAQATRLAEAVADIESLISVILNKLEASSYLDGTAIPVEVEVFERRRFGKSKHRRSAGWPICSGACGGHSVGMSEVPVTLLRLPPLDGPPVALRHGPAAAIICLSGCIRAGAVMPCRSS